MKCKFCKEEAGQRKNGTPRVYCPDKSCRQLFRVATGVEKQTFLEVLPEYPSIDELEEREDLCSEALSGDRVARLVLKHRYSLTGLWDGRQRVAL